MIYQPLSPLAQVFCEGQHMSRGMLIHKSRSSVTELRIVSASTSIISRAALERIWKMELMVCSSVVSQEGRPMVPKAQCVLHWFSRAWSTQE